MKLDKNNNQKNMVQYSSSISGTPSRLKLGLGNKNYNNAEIWIDGPKSKTNVSPVNKILTPGESINFNEIWIDGPRAMRKTKSKNRHSIDQTQKINSYFESIKDMRFDSTNSDECLDKALLKQINDQDADLIENFIFSGDSNSRPISLLSVNSTDTYSTATNSTTSSEFNKSESNYIKKLEDLKTSYDKMIFKQTFEPMESLHKTLESFLNLDHQIVTSHQNYRDLDSFERPIRMSVHEKEKRLSRILSPTRLKVQNFQEAYTSFPDAQSSPSGSSSCSNSTNSSATPLSSTPNASFNQEMSANRSALKNRLFFNFNSRNGFDYQCCNSMPSTPLHNNKSCEVVVNQQKRTDNLKTSKKQESILNRIFNRTKSRERLQNGMVFNNQAMRK